MTWNWKILLPIGLVVILVVVLLYTQFMTKAPQVVEQPASSPVEESSKPLPQATGNVDDAVNAILTAIDNEQSLLVGEEDDLTLVGADSQAISDFGQAYNENEF